MPLRELSAMQNVVDRLFYDTLRTGAPAAEVEAHTLAVDVYETETGYTISANVPGVQPDAIQIKVVDNVLTIAAELPQAAKPAEGARAQLLERPSGRFSRRIRLPQPVDQDNADATYDHGVLTLTLPKRAEAQPKTIQVKTVVTPEVSAN
jgi:HSP20 family protein